MPRVFSKAKLKAAREKSGMSRPQLATAVGVDPSAVFRWEDPDDLRVPGANHLFLLAEKLGVSVNGLSENVPDED